MYYIEQQEDELVKYEVKINVSELMLLKHKIVTECGKIIRHSYNNTCFPEYNDYTHIRNFRYEKVGVTEKSVDIYHIKYDQYEDTKLVTLIDKLLAGETKVIQELKNPISNIKVDEEQKIIEEIKKICDEIKSADTISIINLTEKLGEYSQKLKQEQQSKMLNRDRKSDLEYYEETLSHIELIEISRIKLDKIEKLISLDDEIDQFLLSIKSNCINPNINKIYYKKLLK